MFVLLCHKQLSPKSIQFCEWICIRAKKALSMIGGHCMLMLPLCGKGVLKVAILSALVPSTH